MDRFDLEIDIYYLIFILSSTIFTYSIHRIIGMSKVRKFENQGRFAVISEYRSHIIFYAIIGGLASVYTYFNFNLERMTLLIFAGLISILYTLPIFGKSMRLRDFSFIKIFLIAVVWAIVTESIPLYEAGYEYSKILLLFIERACFFIAITIPFDIRDMAVDKTNSVKTIPTAIGKSNATYLAISLLAVCLAIEFYLFGFRTYGSLAALVSYIITAGLVILVRDKKDDYYFSGLMDGTIMLPWMVLQIF